MELRNSWCANVPALILAIIAWWKLHCDLRGQCAYRFGSTLVAEPELVDESFSAIGPFDGAEEIEHDESPNEEGKEGFLNELTKVSNNKTRWWQLKYFWNFHPKNCGR